MHFPQALAVLFHHTARKHLKRISSLWYQIAFEDRLGLRILLLIFSQHPSPAQHSTHRSVLLFSVKTASNRLAASQIKDLITLLVIRTSKTGTSMSRAHACPFSTKHRSSATRDAVIFSSSHPVDFHYGGLPSSGIYTVSAIKGYLKGLN